MRAIDGDALKEEINKKVVGHFNTLLLIDNAPTVDIWQMRQEAIENALKKAEVLYKRSQGEWIKWDFKTFGAMGDWEYKCSNRGKVYGGEYNFCPNCGHRFKNEETYCPNDDAELLTICGY